MTDAHGGLAPAYPIPAHHTSTGRPDGLPPEPSTYTRLWRVEGVGPLRPLLAAILGLAGYMVLVVAVNVLATIFLAWRLAGLDAATVSELSSDGGLVVTSLLTSMAPLILLLPLSFLLSRLVGQKGGWLSSVTGGVRWGWLLQCAGIGAAVFVGSVLVAAGQDTSASLSLKPGSSVFLFGLFVLMPLQAAGIEYLLRGVVNRGAASLTRSPVTGAVLGALVSTAAYLSMHIVILLRSGDVWGGFVWVLLGLLLSFVAWRTGGLEACIVLGSIHLLLTSLPALVTGLSWHDTRTGNGVAALDILVPVAVAGASMVLLARARGIQRSTVVSATATSVADGRRTP
ncbi:CPBP family glutamic-type intramembrane protease [Tessaracoccus sp.]